MFTMMFALFLLCTHTRISMSFSHHIIFACEDSHNFPHFHANLCRKSRADEKKAYAAFEDSLHIYSANVLICEDLAYFLRRFSMFCKNISRVNGSFESTRMHSLGLEQNKSKVTQLRTSQQDGVDGYSGYFLLLQLFVWFQVLSTLSRRSNHVNVRRLGAEPHTRASPLSCR